MRNEFIETRIIEAVRGLLTERVNEVLNNWEFLIPIIEFGEIRSGYAVAPVVSIASCEQTEKERIIRQDSYLISLTFILQEHEDGELYCYGYSTALAKALNEDITLGGIVNRAVITGKKYIPPKKPHCGEGWGLVITLRLTVEEMSNAG